MSNTPDLSVTRVRHPLKFRLLEATHVQALTPHLIRVHFTGEDLSDFESASLMTILKSFSDGQRATGHADHGTRWSGVPCWA